MQDELGVSRELMYNLPLEKKWELYLSKQKVNIYLTVFVSKSMLKFEKYR